MTGTRMRTLKIIEYISLDVVTQSSGEDDFTYVDRALSGECL